MGRTVDLTLDFQDLPEDEATTLRALLEEANFLSLDEHLPPNPIPDGFSYRITVETERIEHTVYTSDGNVPDSLRPLLDELSRQARLQGR